MDYTDIQKQRLYLVCVIVIIIGVILFSPGGLYFLNDDLIHIPLSSKGVLMQRHSWRPIGDLSIALDWYLWGKNAWGYHLSSLLLHGISTILAGAFVNTLFLQYIPESPQRLIVSRLTAVIFFIYAFHSETVFWIIGRSASLAMMFALPAIIFYLKRHLTNRFIWLSVLFFQMALFCYESVWIFPVLAGLFSVTTIIFQGGSRKKEWVYLTVIWVSFVIHLFIRFLYLGEVAGTYEASYFKAFNVSTLASNYLKLLLRTFLPPVQQSWQLVAGAAVLLCIALIIIYRLRKAKTPVLIPAIAGFCLLLSYLPYLSLGIDTHGVESERYLYMPSVFAALLIAWCIMYVFTPYAFPVFILVSAYHLFFLYVSRTYFVQASHISKVMFTQVNVLSNKRRLFIDSLPGEVRGALIFRLGFNEGVSWLKENKTVDSVIILSRKINDIGNEHFSNKEVGVVINSSGEELGLLQHYIYNTGFKSEEPDSLFLFNPTTDAYFRYDKGYWLIWK